jgi:hypothetical protein
MLQVFQSLGVLLGVDHVVWCMLYQVVEVCNNLAPINLTQVCI